MPKSVSDRIVWKDQGGQPRAYMDLRDLGFKSRVALKPAGSARATTDPAVALQLATAMLSQLQGENIRRERLGLVPGAELYTYAKAHLASLELAGTHDPAWVKNLGRYLARAVVFFDRVQAEMAQTRTERMRCTGPRNLATISPVDVREYIRWLKKQPNGKGGTQGPQSIRHHLSALGGVFVAAIGDGLLPLEGNPVKASTERPAIPRSRTPLREPWELALLLEEARTFDPKAHGLTGRRRPLDCVHALIAFFCYTGAREGEVKRADVRDLLFNSPNGPEIVVHGSNKGKKREEYELERVVPMHPDLEIILREHIRRTGRLAGPLFTGNDGEPLGDWGKTLERIARMAGFQHADKLDTRQFRKAYATHRCSCDGVSANEVRQEIGHTDLKLLASTYASAQRRSERMGAEFSYAWTRWAHAAPPARIEGRGVPVLSAGAQEKAATVAAFLAAVEGMGIKRAMQATGVDKAVVQRLRTGNASTVQDATLEKMRAYLTGLSRATA